MLKIFLYIQIVIQICFYILCTPVCGVFVITAVTVYIRKGP